jgi:hypothetical protein
MFMFASWCTYILVLENTKTYLKFTLKCSYKFRSLWPSRGSLYLGLSKVTIVKILGKTRRYILCRWFGSILCRYELCRGVTACVSILYWCVCVCVACSAEWVSFCTTRYSLTNTDLKCMLPHHVIAHNDIVCCQTNGIVYSDVFYPIF